MDIRLLRYFLAVAKEQNFSKAAQQLHITQPTLSRQILALEEELGIELFTRGKRSLVLTDEGLLLKRRALEIIELEEKMLLEIKKQDDHIEGKITIGCGEFTAMETIGKICKTYNEKYPMVQIVLHTATADCLEEMMNKGLIDIGIFLEPVDIKGYDYIRLNQSDCWVVGIRPDDPLAKKEYITKEDLLDKPLILPKRENLQIELENWFGKDIQNLIVPLTSNLGTNAGIMAMYGLGYPLSVGGAVKYWREDLLVQRKLYPEIMTNTIIAWRRNIPHSLAVKKFIKEMKVLE